MTKNNVLKVILVLAVGGMLFSGYLSYGELFGTGSCEATTVSCGTELYILGLPACVYGLLMYTLVFIASILGLKTKE
jgi:uncharacterized membrane protein